MCVTTLLRRAGDTHQAVRHIVVRLLQDVVIEHQVRTAFFSRQLSRSSSGKVVRSARCVVFQMAEVAVPRHLFRTILHRIHRLRPAKAASG